MNIVEAVKEAHAGKSEISRKAWDYPYEYSGGWIGPAVRLVPTNTPDGFLLKRVLFPQTYESWYPREEDILAEDWFII